MPHYIAEEAPLKRILRTNCRLVYDYWNGLRGDAFAPSWIQVELMDLLAEVVRFVRVLDVIDGGGRFVYRFWGTGMVDVLGEERTQRNLQANGTPGTDLAVRMCRAVVAERQPVGYFLQLQPRNGEAPFSPVTAPGIRLPLSSDGRQVDHILCYTDFGADRERWRSYYESRP